MPRCIPFFAADGDSGIVADGPVRTQHQFRGVVKIRLSQLLRGVKVEAATDPLTERSSARLQRGGEARVNPEPSRKGRRA